MHTIVQPPILLIGYYEDASISCLPIASRRHLDGTFARCRSSFRYAALAVASVCLHATGASATTLQTPFGAGNTNVGEVFQIEALTGMTITDFGINASIDGSANNYASFVIYEHVGGLNVVTGGTGIWTPIFSGGAVTSSGADVVTDLPAALNIQIAAGNTDTFLLFMPGNALAYTDGGSVGSELASNTDLDILQGWGESYDFSTFDPREANVSVEYTVSPVPEPASLAIFGLGIAGLGFVRRRGKPCDQGARLESPCAP